MGYGVPWKTLYRSKSVKDWAIYHIFPVVSLTPRPRFGILPDVEICTPHKKINNNTNNTTTTTTTTTTNNNNNNKMK